MGSMTRYAPEEKDVDRPHWSDVAAWAERKAARELMTDRRKRPMSETYVGVERWDLGDVKTVLDFEAENHAETVKPALIAKYFKVMPTRYYQRLNAVLDTAEALEYDPVLVHRLLERRAAQMGARAGRSVVVK